MTTAEMGQVMRSASRLLVKVQRAAHLLDVSSRTIRRLVDRGELIRVGRRQQARIDYQSILDYCKRQRESLDDEQRTVMPSEWSNSSQE